MRTAAHRLTDRGGAWRPARGTHSCLCQNEGGAGHYTEGCAAHTGRGGSWSGAPPGCTSGCQPDNPLQRATACPATPGVLAGGFCGGDGAGHRPHTQLRQEGTCTMRNGWQSLCRYPESMQGTPGWLPAAPHATAAATALVLHCAGAAAALLDKRGPASQRCAAPMHAQPHLPKAVCRMTSVRASGSRLFRPVDPSAGRPGGGSGAVGRLAHSQALQILQAAAL